MRAWAIAAALLVTSIGARTHIQPADDLMRVPPSTPAIVELATMTGGQMVIADRADRLRDAFAAAASQFRNRYLITYHPNGVDAGGWHPIQVTLKGKHGTVIARRGYSK